MGKENIFKGINKTFLNIQGVEAHSHTDNYSMKKYEDMKTKQ